MILVKLAGGFRSSASYSTITLLVCASNKIYEVALIWGGGGTSDEALDKMGKIIPAIIRKVVFISDFSFYKTMTYQSFKRTRTLGKSITLIRASIFSRFLFLSIGPISML